MQSTSMCWCFIPGSSCLDRPYSCLLGRRYCAIYCDARNCCMGTDLLGSDHCELGGSRDATHSPMTDCGRLPLVKETVLNAQLLPYPKRAEERDYSGPRNLD